jgi:hypothetical protein
MALVKNKKPSTIEKSRITKSLKPKTSIPVGRPGGAQKRVEFVEAQFQSQMVKGITRVVAAQKQRGVGAVDRQQSPRVAQFCRSLVDKTAQGGDICRAGRIENCFEIPTQCDPAPPTGAALSPPPVLVIGGLGEVGQFVARFGPRLAKEATLKADAVLATSRFLGSTAPARAVSRWAQDPGGAAMDRLGILS